LETKRIPPLESWLTDIDMSKSAIRSSGMPAFVHADTQVPVRQARDFHSAAARLLWKTLILRLSSRSNYTKVQPSTESLRKPLNPRWRSITGACIQGTSHLERERFLHILAILGH
jgi:hypothetical protein